MFNVSSVHCYSTLQVLQYLLDDVSDFLSTPLITTEEKRDNLVEEKGCVTVLTAFIDFITGRERENFRSRRHDNEDSVTLTTIHQVLPLSQIVTHSFFFKDFSISMWIVGILLVSYSFISISFPTMCSQRD